MAKFLSHIVTSASGSVGDTTYSRNRNGMYLRKKGIPRQPRTPAQQQVRAAFTAASQAWRGLSDTQRAGWKTLGGQMTTVDSLGQSSTMTGSQAYLSLNGVLSTTGASTPLSDAPAQPETAGPLPTITLAASRAGTAQGTFSLAVQSGAYSGKVQVYATPPVSAGRDFFGRSSYRLLSVIDGLTTGTTVVTDAYTAKFGTPTVGSKIAVKLVPITSDGFKGANYVATAVVGIGS